MDYDRIISALKEKFDSEIILVQAADDFLNITLKAERIHEIVKHLYDHPDAQLQFLTSLCAVHYPEPNQIAVVYQLHNLVTNVRVRIKTFLLVDLPVIHTISDIFAGANWMERETYDFYGVTFIGHPNLKRILNVDDMIIFPLRKEYPLEDQTREDKKDMMFGR
jgi:NADH-quinone oxidoreductase subunit C